MMNRSVVRKINFQICSLANSLWSENKLSVLCNSPNGSNVNKYKYRIFKKTFIDAYLQGGWSNLYFLRKYLICDKC